MEESQECKETQTCGWCSCWLDRYGGWFKRGWELYQQNLVLLFAAGVIATVLSVMTAGILAGPLSLGMYLIVLRLIDRSEPKPEIIDVFKGVDFFLQAFLFMLFWTIVFALGLYVLWGLPLAEVLVVLFFVCIHTVVIFGLLFIGDQKMQFLPASLESVEIVKKDFVGFLCFSLATIILVDAAPLLFCGHGAFFNLVGFLVALAVTPIYYCAIAIAYRESCPKAEDDTAATGASDTETDSSGNEDSSENA